MAKLKWTRNGDEWSAQIDSDRIARIHHNWLGPRRRSYTVTIGLNNYGDCDSLSGAKFTGQLASERRLPPIRTDAAEQA